MGKRECQNYFQKNHHASLKRKISKSVHQTCRGHSFPGAGTIELKTYLTSFSYNYIFCEISGGECQNSLFLRFGTHFVLTSFLGPPVHPGGCRGARVASALGGGGAPGRAKVSRHSRAPPRLHYRPESECQNWFRYSKLVSSLNATQTPPRPFRRTGTVCADVRTRCPVSLLIARPSGGPMLAVSSKTRAPRSEYQNSLPSSESQEFDKIDDLDQNRPRSWFWPVRCYPGLGFIHLGTAAGGVRPSTPQKITK